MWKAGLPRMFCSGSVGESVHALGWFGKYGESLVGGAGQLKIMWRLEGLKLFQPEDGCSPLSPPFSSLPLLHASNYPFLLPPPFAHPSIPLSILPSCHLFPHAPPLPFIPLPFFVHFFPFLAPFPSPNGFNM